MTIRQLEKKIKQVDRKLLRNRRIIHHYFRYTIMPFFKQLNPLAVAGGLLVVFYLMRKKVKKYFLPVFIQLSKRALSSYLLLQKPKKS